MLRKRILIITAAALLAFVLSAGTLFYLATARVQGHYLDADGVRLHYTVQGEGEPLILIHGLSVHADINWRRNGIIDALDDHFQVIAYDVRGHGLSDRPKGEEAYGDELVRDVGRVMDHLGLESAHFAGYSLGGFITLDFMARHPERVRSAALCAAGWRDPASDGFLSWRKGGKPSYAKKEPDKPAIAEKERPISRALMAGFDFIRPLRMRLAGLIADPDAPRAIRRSARNMEGVSPEQLEASIIPTHCFIGSEDGFLPYADALAGRKPNTELTILDGANHLTTVLQPELREGLVEFFLTQRASENRAAP